MIISVASGKGGTGKTLVATSLALSLKDKQKIQLLDCDVEEPNDHIFLKPDIKEREAVNILVPQVNEDICTYCGRCAQVCVYHAIAVLPRNVLVFPHLCHGCGADAIITSCPMCDGVLRRPSSQFGLPKIFITDLCRIALGEKPWPEGSR